MSTTSITTIRKATEAKDFRRIEVITGVGRRRRWSEEAKAKILAETFEEGAVISAIARKYGIAASQIFEWRKQLRERAREDADLAQVVLQNRAPSSPAQSKPQPPGPMIEIEFDAARVRVPSGAAPETVEAVLRGLSFLKSRR